MNKVAIKLIKAYQEKISSQTNPRCRHTPTCSNYGLVAYKRFNFFKATFLTTRRILTCNPLFKPKYDPVPEKVLKPNENLIFACIKKDCIEESITAYSLSSFLKKTDEFNLVDSAQVIICLDKSKITHITISNGYQIKRLDALEFAIDILNYETYDDGTYKRNKAFKKLEPIVK